MNIITILFKDLNDQFYIGKTEKINNIIKITEFDYLNLEQIQKNFSTLKTNQFVIIKVEKELNFVKITPIKECTLTNSKNKNINLYKLKSEKLLKLLNEGIPQEYFNNLNE